MRLLCKIGIHKAAPGACWNAGHCFGKCRGCGRDLVRTPQGKWRVPKGYRVVWKSPAETDIVPEAPPVVRAPLIQPPAMPAPPPRPVAPPARELPIQAVLRRLDSDFMDDAEEPGAVDTGDKLRVQRACTRALSYDFMDEEAPSVSQRAAPSAADVARDEAAFADRLANVNGVSR